VEKYLAMRGIIPEGSEKPKSQKEVEAQSFLLESSYLAGDSYQLDPAEMRAVSDYVEEMEADNVIELEASTFNYAETLTQTMRTCEDPFEQDIKHLEYQMNPAEPTKPIKTLEMCQQSRAEN